MESMGRLKPARFLYNNIFLVGSLLHAGNNVEYFSKYTKKLVVFYLLGTLKEEKDFIQVYSYGRLVETKTLFCPKLPIINYFFVYFWYVKTIVKYFDKKERFYLITFHPIFFIGNSLLKKIRKFEIVFWIADYLPSSSFIYNIYQRLIFYYHNRNTYNLYLGDKLNMKMNGQLKSSNYQKTLMWGIKLEEQKKRELDQIITLAFIGVIRKSHGLDIAFKLLQEHPSLKIKILGECGSSLYEEYSELIGELGIKERVVFENKFYPTENLLSELSTCFAGIALYNTDKNNPIYYTDPGKVKTFTQFGLPVIITNTSEIIPFIKKFKAGEIVDRNTDSIFRAIEKMKNNYTLYLKGVEDFNNYFNCETYYKKAFQFLETD